MLWDLWLIFRHCSIGSTVSSFAAPSSNSSLPRLMSSNHLEFLFCVAYAFCDGIHQTSQLRDLKSKMSPSWASWPLRINTEKTLKLVFQLRSNPHGASAARRVSFCMIIMGKIFEQSLAKCQSAAARSRSNVDPPDSESLKWPSTGSHCQT